MPENKGRIREGTDLNPSSLPDSSGSLRGGALTSYRPDLSNIKDPLAASAIRTCFSYIEQLKGRVAPQEEEPEAPEIPFVPKEPIEDEEEEIERILPWFFSHTVDIPSETDTVDTADPVENEDRVRTYALPLPAPCEITGITVRTVNFLPVAPVGSRLQIGLYNGDSSQATLTRLCAVFFDGNLVTVTPGTYTVNLNTPVTIPSGLVVMAIRSDVCIRMWGVLPNFQASLLLNSVPFGTPASAEHPRIGYLYEIDPAEDLLPATLTGPFNLGSFDITNPVPLVLFDSAAVQYHPSAFFGAVP